VIETPERVRFSVDVYEHGDIQVWLTEPSTGVRIGVGRNDDGQPFVQINTEDAVDPEVDQEPILCVLLNDATLYDVEPSGPHAESICHHGGFKHAGD